MCECVYHQMDLVVDDIHVRHADSFQDHIAFRKVIVAAALKQDIR